MADNFDLQRFRSAQDQVYQTALAELRDGRKRSHWMWFMFPQIKGLGSSAMALRYAIGSKEEAQAYLSDPVLSSRLREMTGAMLDLEGVSAHDVLGYPDDAKFRSSMTLFAAVGSDPIYNEALGRFFDGRADEMTLEILRGSNA
ncbi:DUF1810 domain-containing protein [Rhizobium tubonense]|uniref:Calpastatin n=1 Tax=Rhizobium tubonense TaxID=484088 RepID=A0A2W4F6R6_9HYPH|nr:DUF1810 domain-containing protein [Rhizobium tubonense]PZM17263.1 calpastatin [Rhizobium tubonense]